MQVLDKVVLAFVKYANILFVIPLACLCIFFNTWQRFE